MSKIFERAANLPWLNIHNSGSESRGSWLGKRVVCPLWGRGGGADGDNVTKTRRHTPHMIMLMCTDNNKPKHASRRQFSWFTPSEGCFQMDNVGILFYIHLLFLPCTVWQLVFKESLQYKLVSRLHLFPLKFLDPGPFGKMKKITSRPNLAPVSKEQLWKVAPIT